MSQTNDRARHRVFTDALRGAGPGEAVEISKTTLPVLPRSYETTLLGTPPSLVVPGSTQQYRGPYGRHVYERTGAWVVHRDAADPRREPVEHLVADAPEWGAGLAVATVSGVLTARWSYERDIQRGLDQETASRNAVVKGAGAAAAAGLVTYGAVRLLKAIFRKK